MAGNILLLLVAVTSATAKSLPYHSDIVIDQFKEFVKTYDKKYENEIVEAVRFGIFLKNLDFIDLLNMHSDSAEFGITQFADMTNEEIKMWNTGMQQPDFGKGCTPTSDVNDINVTATQFDWRTKGVVSPVKNQGQCGSCWAFSTIGNVESVNAIKAGSLALLSEQQLVDCETSSHGCQGGWPESALGYLMAKGSMSGSSYPYVARQQGCRYDSSKVSVRVNNCYSLKIQEGAFDQKLQQMGPLSILLDATILSNYKGGVISGNNCRANEINHAVLLVGFGEEGGVQHWIIKNSWGESWGEQGYFRLQRGVNCLVLAKYPPVTAVI